MPNRADGTLLPAVLAAMLAAALVAALSWVGREEPLPPVMAVGAARPNFADLAVAPVEAPRVIFARPLFAPRQSAVAASGGAPPPLLGGASVAGSVTVQGRSYAVVRRPDGTIVRLPIGGAVGGWRLAGLGEQGAVFVKGKARQTFAYGAQAAAGTPGEAPPE